MIVGMLDRMVRSRAPDFPKKFKWYNTITPLSLDMLRGCVVVIDFWTYCCINCMHMLKVLGQIEESYRDSPVVVIGVHSAKFANERKPENVLEAMKRYEVAHPVVVDEGMELWREYGASAWPTIIIVDPKGNIAFKHAGEMQFPELDGVVASLLREHEADGTLAKGAVLIEKPKYELKGMLSYPGKLSFAEDGSACAVSDSNHNRVLIIDVNSKSIINTIGDGTGGLRDGEFRHARFHRPQGVLWLDENTIYVADTENHALRKVDLDKGTVKTVAGDGTQGPYVPFEYSGGGLDTKLSSPWDLAYHRGKVLIAMAGLHQIWAYGIEDGLTYPFAGTGREGLYDGGLENAELAQPSGLWVSGDYMYIADSEASAIRSVDLKKRYVSTIVGSGLFKFGHKDGGLYDARLQHPLGVCADGDKVYVADTYNSSIRVIDIAAHTIDTLIGTPEMKSYCKFGDPGCDTLGLYEPSDVKLTRSRSTLYIVDTNNHLIRTFGLSDTVLKTLGVK